MNSKFCESWFEKWFDSPYYSLLYSHRDHEEADTFIQNISRIIELPPRASVLDLGCGEGRHSRVLSALGLNVTGADLSPASIEKAKKYANDNLSFAVHDMRRPIAINYYDAVINLFTSFGYFETERDNIRTIDAVHMCLRKNGWFLIDYFNAHCVREAVTVSSAGEKEVNGIRFHWMKKLSGDKVIKQIVVNDHGNEHDFCESVSLFTLKDFSRMLQGKFDIIQTFGDYDLSAFDVHKSPRLIIVSRKR